MKKPDLTAAVLSLASLPPILHAQPVPQYTAIELGLLPDAFSNVPWAINNQGEVVGWNQGPQAVVRSYIWRPGSGLTELFPPGFDYHYALDISDTGFVVGIAYVGITGANTGRAYRWRDGEFFFLPPFPSSCPGMRPTAVNDAGDTVGNTCPDGGSDGSRAWFYSDASGLIDLTAVGALTAVDINNAGVVTGRSLAGPAYRWSLSAGLELLETLAAPHNDHAIGQGINEANQVVGNSVNEIPGSDPWLAFLVTAGQAPITLSDPVTARSTAYAINELGEAVGSDGTTSTTDQVGWIWKPATGRELIHAELPSGEIISMNRPIDINDAGQITGNSFTIPVGAVILTPLGGDECLADWDDSGTLDSSDFFAFLATFLNGDADFDGSRITDSSDFFAFLAAFFEGC